MNYVKMLQQEASSPFKFTSGGVKPKLNDYFYVSSVYDSRQAKAPPVIVSDSSSDFQEGGGTSAAILPDTSKEATTMADGVDGSSDMDVSADETLPQEKKEELFKNMTVARQDMAEGLLKVNSFGVGKHKEAAAADEEINKQGYGQAPKRKQTSVSSSAKKPRIQHSFKFN
jgi:hypothetical protein